MHRETKDRNGKGPVLAPNRKPMKYKRILPICVVLMMSFVDSTAHAGADGHIQPSEDFPRYWQFHGEPVLLLGGSNDDNLFQCTESRLVTQLDILIAAGGNYVRNTMSCRDSGNVWPFAQVAGGIFYDMDVWNEEYWRRFTRMLHETVTRGVIVQIEIWAYYDFFDYYGACWGEQGNRNPWNPVNNSNYSFETTYLKPRYGSPRKDTHDFFMSVPALNNDRVLLHYQQRYVDRLLRETLPFDNVLFCITNEIRAPYFPAWSAYWLDYIRKKTTAVGKRIETTEIQLTHDIAGEEFGALVQWNDRCTFLDASQNSAVRNGQLHWDNLQTLYRALEDQPRPINHVKIYGADTAAEWSGTDHDGGERFWRNIIGGAASVRFHRPPSGLGLTEKARTHLRSLRMLTTEFDFFRSQPGSESQRLCNRQANEAYLAMVGDTQFVVYFPDGGSVGLDVSCAPGGYSRRWLEINTSRWHDAERVLADPNVSIICPGPGPWAALLDRMD